MKMILDDIPAFLKPGNRYHAPELNGWVYFANSDRETADDALEDHKNSWPGKDKKVELFEPDGPGGFIHLAVYYKP